MKLVPILGGSQVDELVLYPQPTLRENSNFRLNPEKDAPRSVYESLRDHQLATSENLRLLHAYLPPINKRFYEGKLPLPALSWDLSHPNNFNNLAKG